MGGLRPESVTRTHVFFHQTRPTGIVSLHGRLREAKRTGARVPHTLAPPWSSLLWLPCSRPDTHATPRPPTTRLLASLAATPLPSPSTCCADGSHALTKSTRHAVVPGCRPQQPRPAVSHCLSGRPSNRLQVAHNVKAQLH